MRHNHIILSAIVLVAISVAWQSASAQDRGFGLGIILGEPTGVKGKVWLSELNAVDFGFGWSVGGFNLDRYDVSTDPNTSRFHVHVDYLWHNFDFIQANQRFPIYWGFGARMNSGAGYDNSFAARGVGGIAWVGTRETPIDVFLEVVPVLQFNPSTRIGLNGGLGARYFFWR
jgi:hypothetical protein